MQESPTDQGVTLGDQAAAAADAAAEADARANPTSTSHEPDVVELQSGPALTADDLEARLVRLARAIKQPIDTEPAQVARTLDLSLQPSNHSNITGLKGALGSGIYEVEVLTLYRAAPGKHVAVRVEPADGPECPLRFERLRDALATATRYKLTQGPRFLDPSYTFSGTLDPDLKIYIKLTTDSHDKPECVSYVTFSLEEADVKS